MSDKQPGCYQVMSAEARLAWRHRFQEPSPYESDGGHRIGRHPDSLTLTELEELDGLRTAMEVIRAKCIDCCGGSQSEVRKCTTILCPNWPLRMGHYPASRPARGRKKPSMLPVAPEEVEP